MSNPATPAPTTPPLPTRRQLDELEALLQRMLELPVQPADDIEDYSPAGLNQVESAWTETANEDVADGAPYPAISDPPAAVYSEWESATAAPPIRTETAPDEAASWNRKEAAALDSVDGETAEEPTSQSQIFASEHPRPEPGIFRVLLGWSGLVCLILSLAILLLDWFGWTW